MSLGLQIVIKYTGRQKRAVIVVTNSLTRKTNKAKITIIY